MNSEQHETTQEARRSDLKSFRHVTAVFAVLCVFGGAVVGFMQERLGIAPDVARTVATVLVIAGVGNTLVLYFWARLFGRL